MSMAVSILGEGLGKWILRVFLRSVACLGSSEVGGGEGGGVSFAQPVGALRVCFVSSSVPRALMVMAGCVEDKEGGIVVQPACAWLTG